MNLISLNSWFTEIHNSCKIECIKTGSSSVSIFGLKPCFLFNHFFYIYLCIYLHILSSFSLYFFLRSFCFFCLLFLPGMHSHVFFSASFPLNIVLWFLFYIFSSSVIILFYLHSFQSFFCPLCPITSKSGRFLTLIFYCPLSHGYK